MVPPITHHGFPLAAPFCPPPLIGRPAVVSRFLHMSMSRPPPLPSPSRPLNLDVTIVSAKHLKNVNWRNGDLKPYAIVWVNTDRRLATKSDDSGSTCPVWNERFVIPITLSITDASLSIEIFHSKPSDAPKPLVGTLCVPLKDLLNPDDSNKLRTFELRRPSGRAHGKIRLKLAIKERALPSQPVPDYYSPPSSYYYSTSSTHPPPPCAHHYRGYLPSPYPYSLPSMSPSPPYSYSAPYLGYYSGYYSPPPPPTPPRPFLDRQLSYGEGPSAPVDYSPYDWKPKGNKWARLPPAWMLG